MRVRMVRTGGEASIELSASEEEVLPDASTDIELRDGRMGRQTECVGREERVGVGDERQAHCCELH